MLAISAMCNCDKAQNTQASILSHCLFTLKLCGCRQNIGVAGRYMRLSHRFLSTVLIYRRLGGVQSLGVFTAQQAGLGLLA